MARQYINDGLDGINYRAILNQNFEDLYTSGSTTISASTLAAYTNKENRFTGSQYIDASDGIIDGNKYSLKIDNTHTGSYASMHGIYNDTKWDSTSDAGWIRGIYNLATLQSSVTASGLIGLFSGATNRGYAEYVAAIDTISKAFGYTESLWGSRVRNIFYSGSITENVKGLEVAYTENEDATVIDSYGIYIDIPPTAATGDNYAIYSVHDIPSYFGGQIQGSGSLVIDASHNGFTDAYASYGIRMSANYTGSLGTTGIQYVLQHNGPDTVEWQTGNNNSLYFNAPITASYVAGTFNSIYNYNSYFTQIIGYTNNIRNEPGASATEMYGVRNRVRNNGGSVNTVYGYQLRMDNTGTTENEYGLYMYDLGGATNSYAIYIDSNVPSYFGGKIEIANRMKFVTPSTGIENTFIGSGSGQNITTEAVHQGNTAYGYLSMDYPVSSSTISRFNVAVGMNSLGADNEIISVQYNTAIGLSSAAQLRDGRNNTSIGRGTMSHVTSGSYNTAIGNAAMVGNIDTGLGTGDYNIAIGSNALSYFVGSYNIGIGKEAGHLATGSGCIFIGHSVGYNANGTNLLMVGTGSNPLIYGDMDAEFISMQATTSSVTPHASGSIAFQLDEANNKLMFQIKYSDGTIHSASADIF